MSAKNKNNFSLKVVVWKIFVRSIIIIKKCSLIVCGNCLVFNFILCFPRHSVIKLWTKHGVVNHCYTRAIFFTIDFRFTGIFNFGSLFFDLQFIFLRNRSIFSTFICHLQMISNNRALYAWEPWYSPFTF